MPKHADFTVKTKQNKIYSTLSLFPEDCFAFMWNWLDLGVLDLCQQAAVYALRDDRCLHVNRHAVIREVVICFSRMAPEDGYVHSSCFYLKLKLHQPLPSVSVLEDFADISWNICIPSWFIDVLKTIEGLPQNVFSLQKQRADCFILWLYRKSGLLFSLLLSALSCRLVYTHANAFTDSVWLASVWLAASTHVTERVSMWHEVTGAVQQTAS